MNVGVIGGVGLSGRTLKRILLTSVSASLLTTILTMTIAPATAIAGEAPVQFNEGFYMGAMVGRADADNKTLENSPISAPMNAGQGFSGGLVMGYDQWISGVMMGVEAEITAQDVRGSFIDSTGTAKFSMPRTFGLSLRAGVPVTGRILPYGKIGITAAEANFKPLGAEANVNETLLGVKLGVGLDVPMGDGWTWKSEFIHTRYQGWSQSYPNQTGSDEHWSFNNISVSTAMTGLSYGFGRGLNVKIAETPAPNLDGLYMLGMAGWGGTDLDRTRPDGSSTGNEFIAATGAELGMGLGYRVRLGNGFIAPEVTINRTDNQYRIKNETTGATLYRLEKKWETDAVMRGGYYVTDRLAAFGTVGAAVGRFELADHPQRDSQNIYGLVLGAGIEYDMGDNVALRAEYLHRRFKDWATTDSSGDVTFTPKSGTTRIGVAYYF